MQKPKLMMMVRAEAETEKWEPGALVGEPVGVEEGIVVDNFVSDVGGVVEGGSVGLGLVAVVDDDGLFQCNGLLQWSCNHLG